MRKEKDRKEKSEMERDCRIWRLCEMWAKILVINGRVESRDKNCRAEVKGMDSEIFPSRICGHGDQLHEEWCFCPGSTALSSYEWICSSHSVWLSAR